MNWPSCITSYTPVLQHRIRRVFVLAVLLAPPLFAAEKRPPVDLSKLPPAAVDSVDYASQIQPLLAEHCYECHGPDKQKSGLRLDSRSHALRGGDNGAAWISGKSAESPLIHRVSGLDPSQAMPPKGNPLTARQVGLLRRWIDLGAHWPEQGTPPVRSSHWAFQPLKPPALPDTHQAGASSELSVDRFITAKLAEAGLRLSPETDRATLIRRVTYDLHGIPPTPEELDDFMRDRSPGSYRALVERLLASPRYGERWARHWLDAARYTESQGFEYDKLRDHGWHYRDYVIESFNQDKPYDRFMAEQIAGDAIESATRESVLATSFLVCGPWDEAGNAQANATQKAITREEELEDVLSVVGQTFLGLTINCARCHSHKFDPISQEEYYRVRSVFDGVKHGERPIATAAEIRDRDQTIADLKRSIEAVRDRRAAVEGVAWKRALANRDLTNHAEGVDSPSTVPAPAWRWPAVGKALPAGRLENGAATGGHGVLVLSGKDGFFRSELLAQETREKTLEAWVSISSTSQQGGGVISIEREDGRQFDAIVFGEREPRKWMAGSEGFVRTRNLEAPEESVAPEGLVHLAAVYRSDNTIALFRNGEPYGKPYQPGSPLVAYPAGKSRILLGMRHTGGSNPFFKGIIHQAALYDRALTSEEIAESSRHSALFVAMDKAMAQLSEAERIDWNRTFEEEKALRVRIDALKPFPVSYAGTRVQPTLAKRLLRGDVKSPGEVVSPGALAVVADLSPDFGLAPDAPEASRRLKFAEWLIDLRNPLPARVMANRVWHLHFGQGLVATPNDFGASGARPTHPALLDWLAWSFQRSGWSLKHLHRQIVLSAAYRQSSKFDARAGQVDADNTLLWRFSPRRLEAEAIRDGMLAASGEINWTMRGPSFRPFDALKFPANAYVPSDKIGPEFNRRTVYRMNVNSGKEPLLDAFDCPDPSVKTPRRGATTTPLQALGLMNNSFVQRQAEQLAQRAAHESGPSLSGAIQRAYLLALGRRPTASEAEAAAVAAQDRGLSSVCWTLFNATEFVYVR